MAKKLVVVCHGIGNAPANFHEKWKAELVKNHDASKFDVVGMHWEPILEQVEKKYPLIPSDALAKCGLKRLEDFAKKDEYKTFSDHIMDILAYVGSPDMSQFVSTACLSQLLAICKGREKDTILIGHSLGAAMLPHVCWRIWSTFGVIPFKGSILLASPIAFESPAPSLCDDFLTVMGKVAGGARIETLKLFASAWRARGNDTLKFVINEYDIVCSDVLYDLGGTLLDLIPVRQGFSAPERYALEQAFPGCVQVTRFGKARPDKIGDNHDVVTYLNTEAFKSALDMLIG